MLNLCARAVCVCYILMLLEENTNSRPDLSEKPLGLREFRRPWAGQVLKSMGALLVGTSQAINHPASCCHVLLNGPDTMQCEKRQPEHGGDIAGSSCRGWVICSHRQADGTSWISNL